MDGPGRAAPVDSRPHTPVDDPRPGPPARPPARPPAGRHQFSGVSVTNGDHLRRKAGDRASGGPGNGGPERGLGTGDRASGGPGTGDRGGAPGAGPGSLAQLAVSVGDFSIPDSPFQARLTRWAATSVFSKVRASSQCCPVSATMPTSIWA